MTSSSTANTHTLGWSGVLSVSRGGTGTTTWTTGSIPFFDGTKFTEGNPNINNEPKYDSSDGTFSFGSTGGGQIKSLGELDLMASDRQGDENGSDIVLSAGSAISSDSNAGGDIVFIPGTNSDGSIPGHARIQDPINGFNAIFDTSALSSTLLFSFPDLTGTFALLEGSDASTIQIGNIKSCIAMADSDGSGITYVTANDGVLSATTTQPSNCQ
jgi:hypothetical protein